MLTPSAFIDAPGHLGLDLLGMTIGKEPNYLTYAESGVIQERTRIDGPLVRFDYVPSERAEFQIEFNGQTYAIKDPRYQATISDWGDVTLRAKMGLKKGEVGASPAVATQFEVTLPNTSFGNGLGPNTIRLAAVLLVGYKTDKLTLERERGPRHPGRAPARARAARLLSLLPDPSPTRSQSTSRVFVDAGGFFGTGTPGAIAKREARGGFQYQHSMFGKESKFYVGARRGLVDFTGDWGVVAGLTTHLRSGVTP